ncbi:MAG: DNA gyrase modulator, partial [Candidatus Poseidoniaceae archaeon]|nr:DNA gyrase modulator [Candidatus Poseidoniaceae archaeon]
MTLMPEDSCDRLLDGCQSIAAAAAASDATMWEVFAIQSYGLEVEIERGRVSLAGGGGDGGYGIRVLNDGRIGFAYSAGLDGAQQMIEEALRASTL